MAAANKITVGKVEIIPVARPAITLVPATVEETVTAFAVAAVLLDSYASTPQPVEERVEKVTVAE